MKQPLSIRRMTSLLVKRPLRRIIFNDYQQHITSEMYASVLQGSGHQFEKLRSKFTDAERQLERELGIKEGEKQIADRKHV